MKLSLTKTAIAAALALATSLTAHAASAGTFQANDRNGAADEHAPNPHGANCPNLGIGSLKPQIVSRNAVSARVRYTAEVYNMGQQPYVSQPNKQIISLKKGVGYVAHQKFHVLYPGQLLRVSWEETIPATGYPGVPPVIRAMVRFHPSLAIDGDPANDDCRAADNQRAISGNIVNNMLN